MPGTEPGTGGRVVSEIQPLELVCVFWGRGELITTYGCGYG